MEQLGSMVEFFMNVLGQSRMQSVTRDGDEVTVTATITSLDAEKARAVLSTVCTVAVRASRSNVTTLERKFTESIASDGCVRIAHCAHVFATGACCSSMSTCASTCTPRTHVESRGPTRSNRKGLGIKGDVFAKGFCQFLAI